MGALLDKFKKIGVSINLTNELNYAKDNLDKIEADIKDLEDVAKDIDIALDEEKSTFYMQDNKLFMRTTQNDISRLIFGKCNIKNSWCGKYMDCYEITLTENGICNIEYYISKFEKSKKDAEERVIKLEEKCKKEKERLHEQR